MSETRKSIFAAFGIVMSIGAVYGGLRVRQNADLGTLEASAKDAPVSRMLASRTNDVNVPAADYFYELSQKLKEQYVEPVTDDQKLASGAIRGMISSLGDPDSSYMDKDQFKAFLNARVGKFEGIGADFVLEYDSRKGGDPRGATKPKPQGEIEMDPEDALVNVQEIPKVEVVTVVPGGPADKAGVQIGDTVDTIDGHWIVNSNLIRKFRVASKKFTDKKMTRAQLEILRSEVRSKFDKAIFPGKAKEKLFMGKSGSVSVIWSRNGTLRSTTIQRGVSSLNGFTQTAGTINLPFVDGSAESLKAAIRNRDSVIIDLRNNSLGDVQAMKHCLEVIAPKGQYGYFITRRHDSPTPLAVLNGNPNPPRIKLITDRSTRGMAEAFALALSSKGLATLTSSSMGGDTSCRQIVQLPDGSGYTLVTSTYSPTLAKSMVTKKGGA
jgi:carboxyl-terminal processing protease